MTDLEPVALAPADTRPKYGWVDAQRHERAWLVDSRLSEPSTRWVCVTPRCGQQWLVSA